MSPGHTKWSEIRHKRRDDPESAAMTGSPNDFDRYLAEHNIPEEEWPEAFALWLAEQTGGSVPDFEQVEDGAAESKFER
jgi:hypothetical protein